MRRALLAAFLLAATTVPAVCAGYNDLNTGIGYFNSGAWENATLWLGKAIDAGDLIPDQMRVARLDRGMAYFELQKFDSAIADFSAILAVQPDDPTFLAQRASAYLNTGKWEEAGTDLDRLVINRPQLSIAYVLRAIVNVKRGQMDKVREDLKKVLSLRPEGSARSRVAGIIQWQLGQIAEADDNFSHAATHGQGDVYAWLWYTLTELRLGKKVPRGDLPDFDKKQWPAPIVSFFLGETSKEALLAAAEQGQARAIKGQVCEANFYVGEWLLQHHDQAAKSLIGKAAGDCPINFVEWSPAQLDFAGLP